MNRRVAMPGPARLLRRAAAVCGVASSLACPSDPLAEARRLEARGDRDAAARAYLEAARSDPANLAAWDGAAAQACRGSSRVALCLEVLDLELELLGRVERHADQLARALEDRGRARLEQGLVEAGLQDLTRSQEVGPERASVFAAQARAYMMQGRRVEAMERVDQLRRRDPDYRELKELEALLGIRTETEHRRLRFRRTDDGRVIRLEEEPDPSAPDGRSHPEPRPKD